MLILSMKFCAITVAFYCLTLYNASAQAEWAFRGQASALAHVNPNNVLPFWTGARYIPQVNLDFTSPDNAGFGLEASANVSGSAGFRLADSLHTEYQLKPYRLWARYTSNHVELRLGLQKINFGSANMLRPLMWFDQVDPRDPLQLTDGVWAFMGRYYFMNNANLWFWALYGNEGPKTWETGPTTKETAEYGGRVQVPLPGGEAGLSFHHRKTDQFLLLPSLPYSVVPAAMHAGIPENRYGFDARLDVEVGLWLEASWINKRHDLGVLTNQQNFVLGADYTFGIGNGVNISAEHLLMSFDKTPFAMQNKTHFTAVSANYPLGLFDQLGCIVYYDWTNNHAYSFASWQHQFRRVTMYLMAFANPERFQLPQQNEASQLFFGKGVQLMFVYHH